LIGSIGARGGFVGFELLTEQAAMITEKFGQDFCDDMRVFLPRYCELWGVDIVEIMPNLSINCIFKGVSDLYGDVVLKMYRRELRGVATEAVVLSEYDGYRFCRLLNSDVLNGVLLLEYISPATLLKDEPSLTNRLDAFLSLYKGLHRKPKNPQMFPTYMHWVHKAMRRLHRRDDYRDVYSYMLEASDICTELFSRYNEMFLLHGDFHFENILLGANGEYRIIDPKGVLGHPLFDLPRYLLNEYRFVRAATLDMDERLKMMGGIIEYFEKALGIPQIDIRKSFFIETVLANSWMVEDGREPKIDNIIFAKRIMEI